MASPEDDPDDLGYDSPSWALVRKWASMGTVPSDKLAEVLRRYADAIGDPDPRVVERERLRDTIQAVTNLCDEADQRKRESLTKSFANRPVVAEIGTDQVRAVLAHAMSRRDLEAHAIGLDAGVRAQAVAVRRLRDTIQAIEALCDEAERSLRLNTVVGVDPDPGPPWVLVEQVRAALAARVAATPDGDGTK